MEVENKTLACVKRAHKRYVETHREKISAISLKYHNKNKDDPEYKARTVCPVRSPISCLAGPARVVV